MRFLLLLVCCVLLPGATDADLTAYEIVRRSCEKDTENLEIRQKYTYKQSENVRMLEKDGGEKRNERRVKEVLWIDGTTYSRLVAKDGKPLSAKDAEEEREKFDREVAKRKRESTDQRRRRLDRERKELEEDKQLRMQVPEAFTFTLAGTETVRGRVCHRIAAVPKAGFVPKGKHAKLLPKLQGTLWIDAKDYEWVRVEAETLDTLSFGLALIRVGKGAKLEVEQMLINDELWAPAIFRLTASARALLVMNSRLDALVQFEDYKKYVVESVITTDENP